MTHNLLQSDVLVKIVANTLLVSIPEEAFFVVFTLILLGVFNYLSYENWLESEIKLKKQDLMRTSIAIVIPAFISNIIRYTCVDFSVVFTVTFTSIYASIIVTFGIWRNIKSALKALLFFAIAYIIVFVLEIAYIPFILYSTGQTVAELNNSILYSFLISLPERTVEAFLITFLLSKKSTFLKAKLLQPVISSVFVLIMTLGITLFNVGFSGVLCKLIAYDRAFVNVPFFWQVTVIVGSFLLPILNISVLLWILYYKENQKKKRLDNSVEALKGHTQTIRDICTKGKENINVDKLLEQLSHLETEIFELKEE